jgi:hypothetical protein
VATLLQKYHCNQPEKPSTLVGSVFDAAVEFSPLEALPFLQGRKWIRRLRCLSEASFEAFPFFALHKWGPEGQRMRSPSFAYIFLAKQEK